MVELGAGVNLYRIPPGVRKLAAVLVGTDVLAC